MYLKCTPGNFSLLNCYSDQNHNSNPNKTFLMLAKFPIYTFSIVMSPCINMWSKVLDTLLMVQFCEILSNEPSTYINWPDSIHGECLKIEKSVCLFIHSINMISVDRGLTPCRMFFHNHDQEKILQEAISLIKICNSTSKWRIKIRFFLLCGVCKSLLLYCLCL